MSIPLIVLFLPIVALLTAILSGTLGMGGGLILFATFIAYLDPEQAVILHGLTALAALTHRSISFRRHIAWQPIGYYAAGSAVGVAAYYSSGLTLNKTVVAIALGLMCLASAALPKVLKLNILMPRQALVAGIINTFLSLAAGMAVGFIDIFFLRAPMSRFEVLATKAAIFVFACFLKSAYYLVILSQGGAGDLEFLYLVPALAIASIMGIGMGTKIVERISDCTFRRSSVAVLTMLGIFFLTRAALNGEVFS